MGSYRGFGSELHSETPGQLEGLSGGFNCLPRDYTSIKMNYIQNQDGIKSTHL